MGQAMISRRMRALWLAPMAGALLGCAAQVEQDYRGEPMAQLHGTVSALDGETPEVSAAIVWIWPGPDFRARATSERVAVEGSFPASFSITLYEPPPPEAENLLAFDMCVHEDGTIDQVAQSCDDGLLVPKGTRTGAWIGLIAAVDADTPDGEIELDDVVGIDRLHHIFYYDQDPPETLPAMPTAKEAAVHVSNFGYDVPFEAGYQLTKLNPEVAAATRMGLECGWEGLCVHLTDVRPEQQAMREWQFESCVARWPDNPTCEAFSEPPPGGESEESRMCREQGEVLGRRDECGFEQTWDSYLEEIPLGLEDPLTIELGTKVWDFAL